MRDIPEVGELWCYADGLFNKIYLVTGMQYCDYYDTGKEVLLTDLLCLNNGHSYPQYLWPDHTWERIS